jgi:pimeloyl-ACP methyl ester carboxylesterase
MTPEQAAEASIPFNYAATTPRERIEQDWAVRLPLAASPEGYLAQVQGSSAWSGLERLPALRAPTLVVHGGQDRLVPPANGRRIAEAVPGAELVVLPDANHLFFTDQPERTRDILLDWLARHRERPQS